MTIIGILIVLLCIYKIRVTTNGINKTYVSKESTKSINGIFVLIVFLRHFIEYVEDFSTGIIDSGYLLFDALMGQLIVVTFLFYSGYGIMESIKAKGETYINGIVRRRLCVVWLHFIIAVLIYMLLNLMMGKQYSIYENVWAFTGYESIGNSNWYVFAMLMQYLFTFISFKMIKNYKFSIVLMIMFNVIYTVLLVSLGKGIWWYNTIIVYPFGMIYSVIKDKYENFIKQSTLTKYVAILFGYFALFIVCYAFGRYNGYMFWIISILFIMILITITMKISINNKYLVWLGKYTFEIYILQRIPMIVLSEYIDNRYVLCVLCFGVAIVLAILFKRLTNRLDIILGGRYDYNKNTI